MPKSDSPNATSKSCAAGWYFYDSQGGAPSLAEVNRYLHELIMGRISPRTYTHYRKLRAYGHRKYIPINKLDVATAELNQNHNSSVYKPWFTVNQELMFVIEFENLFAEVKGNLIETSFSEFIVQFRKIDCPTWLFSDVAQKDLSNFRVSFTKNGSGFSAAIALTFITNDWIRLTLAYDRAIEVEDFVPVSNEKRIQCEVEIDAGPRCTIYEMQRILKQVSSLFESLENLSDNLVSLPNQAIPIKVPTTRVVELKYENPIKETLEVCQSLIPVFSALFDLANWYFSKKGFPLNSKQEAPPKIKKSLKRINLKFRDLDAEYSYYREFDSNQLTDERLDEKINASLGALVRATTRSDIPTSRSSEASDKCLKKLKKTISEIRSNPNSSEPEDLKKLVRPIEKLVIDIREPASKISNDLRLHATLLLALAAVIEFLED